MFRFINIYMYVDNARKSYITKQSEKCLVFVAAAAQQLYIAAEQTHLYYSMCIEDVLICIDYY